ncbi:MAG: Uma2 family endonuclease, partial [Abditibacteriales bacterium]|nr:Uma2 family endonuclease [Abditibacteriales bacterium]
RVVMGPEIGFIVARDPDTVRAPDWSLTWREQADARRRGAWIEGGPNLAVEVISPEETWSEVQEKVDEYLAAGTQVVWVINPQTRTVHVIRPDAPIAVLRVGDVLTGDPVLPGFTLPLATLFTGGGETRQP